MSNGTLSLHSSNRKTGALPVTRDQLRALPAPRALSEGHRPVAHIDLLEGITGALSKANVTVRRELLAVGGRGNLLFGVIDLQYGEDPQYQAALGLRTSNDMRFAVQIVAGLRVFVCDNLAISGDVITLNRRHTSRLNIATELDGATDRFFTVFATMEKRIGELRSTPVDTGPAKAVILDAAIQGVIPMRLVRDVYDAYFKPKHVEFEPRTLWSLHNAFTTAIKSLPVMSGMDSHAALARLMGV